FIVTGGLRGLGRAMALGLAGAGHRVLAVGHIENDVARLQGEITSQPLRENIAMLAADLRESEACDNAIALAEKKFGRIDGLINNAGLTFTYIDPGAEFGKPAPRFWEIDDRIVQNVMDTNVMVAVKMSSRIAPKLIAQGWGRIINVTTKLETMNRPGTTPYGQSKAALEMASEVWAREIAGTGVTVNILNPGAGAHTEGMADSFRRASREGKMGRFVEPEEMVPPLLWLVSPRADAINGMRYDALTWDGSLDPDAAATRNGIPAGFYLKDK
ncbi:MAG: SDR family NAD(P)-dependent oxidoreductase, partial [Beijerinckiaceae bacterium]